MVEKKRGSSGMESVDTRDTPTKLDVARESAAVSNSKKASAVDTEIQALPKQRKTAMLAVRVSESLYQAVVDRSLALRGARVDKYSQGQIVERALRRYFQDLNIEVE